MGDAYAVDVRGLVKRFGSTTALDGLDLQVRVGEVHGFLGPNGAGKTTTLRILLGLLRANAGAVRLLGGDPWRDVETLHKRLAYVPGDVALWPTLTGGEVIDLLGRVRGGMDASRRDELVARFELDPSKKARTYSKGNRQKVALIAALASDVELLLLDEPTAGLDPLMDAAFRDSIRAYRQQGGTVLLSSHILAEAQALSDRITIIRNGRVMESGTLEQLRRVTGTRVTAEVDTVPEGLDRLAGVGDLRITGSEVSASVSKEGLSDFVAALHAAGLRSLVSEPPSLEELFLRAYARAESAGAS